MAQFKKGQSGNPAGRPKKGYALTDLLKTQLNKTALDVDGKRRANKRILARIAIEAATSGSITFAKASPTGEVFSVTERLEPRDWITWAKYIIDRIDGPSKQTLEHTGKDGGPMEVTSVQLTDDERAERVAAIFDAARDRRDRQAGEGE